MPTEPSEDVLLTLAKQHLNLIAKYNPYRNFTGVKDKAQFAKLISTDPAFSAFGFGDERYITARVGGNLITSLHRKIGDMYEEMFAYLIHCRFDIALEDLAFNIKVRIGDRDQTRSTDGFVPIESVLDLQLGLREGWKTSTGIGFEVRSCYQIGDSKRIQADWDMALSLTNQKIVPVMLVFCNTSLRSPLARLKGSWNVYEGMAAFNFVHQLTQFDLHHFLQSNSRELTKPVAEALSKL